MKIALFGGSFNPVHNEHVNIVKAAARELSLDKVIIIPSLITPNKSGRIAASADDRLNMCRLAFNLPFAEVSDYEIKRGGVSYSYLTCKAFREKYPDDELYFIIGADMLENFPQWKNPGQIINLVTLAVCARENEEGLERAEAVFKARFNKNLVKFGYVGADVSSTKIRAVAALGENVGQYTGEVIARYIDENSLYKLRNLARVKQYLTQKRWEHTVRVAVTAAENCSRIGISEKTAITAAALHDCAKYLKFDSPELEGFTCPENVPEPVVHQYAGAYVAQHTFGVNDEEILDAIRYHTSGKENMSALSKLIFLSDLLEEGRHFDGIEKLREEFSRSIDNALYEALKRQIDYLKSTGKPIYPLTKKAFEYLKEQNDDK